VTHAFAEIIALQQADEVRGCLLQSFNDILAVVDFPLLELGSHLRAEFRKVGAKIPEDDEATQGDSFVQ